MDPGRTRPPLHWFLVALLALNMANAGQLQEALTILFLFETYCRPIEALKLLEKHLILLPLGIHYVAHLHSSDLQESSKMGLQDHSVLLDVPTMPWLGSAIERNKKKVPDAALFRNEH